MLYEINALPWSYVGPNFSPAVACPDATKASQHLGVFYPQSTSAVGCGVRMIQRVSGRATFAAADKSDGLKCITRGDRTTHTAGMKFSADFFHTKGDTLTQRK